MNYSQDIAKICEMILIRDEVNKARKRAWYAMSKAKDSAAKTTHENEYQSLKVKLKLMQKVIRPLVKKANATIGWDANWRIVHLKINDPEYPQYIYLKDMPAIVEDVNFTRLILEADETEILSA